MAEPAVRVVSDVHAGFEALRAVAAADGPLLILGDFLNFIDYRTGEGMVADILGLEFARRAAQARGTGADARPMWMEAISEYTIEPGMTFQADTFFYDDDFGCRWENGVLVQEHGPAKMINAGTHMEIIEIDR